MTDVGDLDFCELEEALVARGFIPCRMWRLYREITGDHGFSSKLKKARRSVRPVDSRRKAAGKRTPAEEKATCYCAECSGAIHRQGVVCPHCGADLYYATWFGFTNRKERKRP